MACIRKCECIFCRKMKYLIIILLWQFVACRLNWPLKIYFLHRCMLIFLLLLLMVHSLKCKKRNEVEEKRKWHFQAPLRSIYFDFKCKSTWRLTNNRLGERVCACLPPAFSAFFFCIFSSFYCTLSSSSSQPSSLWRKRRRKKNSKFLRSVSQTSRRCQKEEKANNNKDFCHSNFAFPVLFDLALVDVV